MVRRQDGPRRDHGSDGREGEGSAGIINAMEKKVIRTRTAFPTSYTNKSLQQYSGGIPIQDHPLTSRRRRSLPIFVVENIFLLVCRDMAIISFGYRLYRFIMRSNDSYGFVRIEVAWRIFALRE